MKKMIMITNNLKIGEQVEAKVAQEMMEEVRLHKKGKEMIREGL
jgi:hypothetical protein